jgi:hypothetical protein
MNKIIDDELTYKIIGCELESGKEETDESLKYE